MYPDISHTVTFQDLNNPSSLCLSCGYHGTQGFDEANHGQSWFWQMCREDVLVQWCLAILNFHYWFIEEGERKGVSSGKDDDVNRLLLWCIVKDDRVFFHLLDAGLDQHFSGDDAAWELIIQHRLSQLSPKQKTGTESYVQVNIGSSTFFYSSLGWTRAASLRKEWAIYKATKRVYQETPVQSY